MCTKPSLLIPNGYKKLPFLDGILIKKNLILPYTPRNERNLKQVGADFIRIPCGHCAECKSKRTSEWAMRLTNEIKYHDNNYFVTLTYDNEHFPPHGSLNKKDFQTFFDILRINLKRKGLKYKFRYYLAAEYGDSTLRPHAHIIFYDLPIPDLSDKFPDGLEHKSQSGEQSYYSEFLSRIWNKGFVCINTVCYDSCKYVAGYVQKKLYKGDDDYRQKTISFGKDGDGQSYVYDVYKWIDPYTAMGLTPPFSLMSKGIGKSYFNDHVNKIYDTDEVICNGPHGVYTCKPPRYYDKLKSKSDEVFINELKEKRKALAISRNIDNIPDSSIQYRMVNRHSSNKIKNSCKVRDF